MFGKDQWNQEKLPELPDGVGAKIGKCVTCLGSLAMSGLLNSSFLGRLPLIPAGIAGTIPHSMQGRLDTVLSWR